MIILVILIKYLPLPLQDSISYLPNKDFELYLSHFATRLNLEAHFVKYYLFLLQVFHTLPLFQNKD